MMALGDKVQRLRVWRGITQTELADGLVTPSMISQIEGNKANPSTELLLNIIQRLGVSVETFLKDVELELEGRALYRFALELVEYRQYGVALKLFRELENTPDFPKTIEFSYEMAICLQNTGKTQEAIDLLDRVLTQAQVSADKPFLAKVLYQMAEAYFQLDNINLARFYAEKADAAVSGVPDYNELQAKVKGILGKAASAASLHEQALSFHETAYRLLIPDSPVEAADSLLHTAIEHTHLGQYQHAGQTFDMLFDLYKKLPSNSDQLRAKFHYARLLRLIHREAEAHELFRECLNEFQSPTLRKWVPLIYGEMSQLEIERGQWEESKFFQRKALDSAGHSGSMLANLHQMFGESYYQKGRCEDAIEHFEKSISLYETDGFYEQVIQILPKLSNCYDQMGNIEQALSTLERTKGYMETIL
ncbi:helix-turn-helix transcriptional regulator [Effusibacillus dendaii]|uniref:HTH cro/C1-type domain-containing protein n=1 Tax=Effusibacillus dendaii TaxID=2743772 RepID=A0A7I8DAC9_9BACL|nr:helix-turn-helix transcriptional regulator [Effusibacillus dendaii]BCJ86937.1 hypothetical protein skT53_19220 [Effusibacillus dendaii]